MAMGTSGGNVGRDGSLRWEGAKVQGIETGRAEPP